RIEEIVCRGIPGLYQVTNTGPATWLEFARMVLDLAGLAQIEIAPVTRAELGQAARRPCNSAMRCLLSEALGLAPLRHWRESLEGFVAESVDSTG
ncbi:MAG TPA: sugar nucleotide-binding protein, partial [Blastocatellia bacterium]|nr:sugar nucleotide-binding protein [Blastocatellia bacterium]